MSIFRVEHLRRSDGVMAVCILAAVLACYWPALHGAVLWDDPAHLTSRELRSWAGLGRIWFELGATQQYYPVVHTAFWIEYRLWGNSVLGYHLINVFLHAASCCLLALILRRLWAPKHLAAGGVVASQGFRPGWEWLAALFLAVHPVCVESVAWISEQKNTLSLFFYLAAGLVYLEFATRRQWLTYVLATVLFLLAVGSKTVASILPATILVLLWWRNDRLSWRRDVSPLLAWIGAAVTAGLFTAWVERKLIGAEGAPFELSIIERVLLACRGIWFYVGKLVWPENLTFFYTRWDVVRDAPHWIGYLLAVAAVTFGFFLCRHRTRAPLAAWLLYLGALFPALGFFNVYPFIFSYVADHFQYQASVVFISAAVGGLAWLVARAAPWLRTAAVIGCGGLVIGLTFLSRAQSGLYRDVETLFRHTIASVPESWMAHHNLGLALSRIPGRELEAITAYRKAIELNPEFPESYFVLGRELMKQPGMQSQAVAELEQAIRLRPYYSEAHAALGTEIAKQPDRLNDAIGHFETALKARPKMAEIHLSFANALARDPERLSKAAAHFEEALRLRPDFAEAHNDYGAVLAKLPGRRTEAIHHIEQALKLEPRNAEAHYNLANALVGIRGREAEAMAEYQEALRIDPRSPLAHYGLANVLAFQRGRAADAVAHYEAAIQLQPGFAEAHANLANVLVQVPQRMADALKHYEAALRIDPNLAWVHFNLGLHLTPVPGRSEDALYHYKEALRLKPDYTDALNGLAILFAQTGRFEEARAQWEKALTIDPGYQVARENLRRLEQMPMPAR